MKSGSEKFCSRRLAGAVGFEQGCPASRARSSPREESSSGRVQGALPAALVSVGRCAVAEEGPRLGGGEGREGGGGRREPGAGRGRGGAGEGRGRLDKREPGRKCGEAGDVRREGRWQSGRKGMAGSQRRWKRRRRRRRGERGVGRTSSQPRVPETLSSQGERKESPGACGHGKEKLGGREASTKASFALHQGFPPHPRCGSRTPP